jgi:hypothetical protein
MEHLDTIFTVGTAAISAAVLVLAVLAPLTKSDKDDKILAALRWVERAIAGLLPKKVKDAPVQP